jgi:tetraacyldisaccharide 4'-kinase
LKICRLPIPVISIGNLTTGGTGKTPFTIELANYFHEKGKKVAIVSRGYRRKSGSEIQVVSDGKQIMLDVNQSGDEPMLMAQKCHGVPVLVGKERYKAAMEAVRLFQTELVILDDGFQHLSLFRDVDVVLIDEGDPFSNGYLIPRGHLREPIDQISRADLVYSIRKNFMDLSPPFVTFRNSLPTAIIYEPAELVDRTLKKYAGLEYLRGKNVVVFCGIGNPWYFLNTAKLSGSNLQKSFVFDDHHEYRTSDMRILESAKDRCAADFLLTTEKDIVKIASLDWKPETIAVSMKLKSADSDSCRQIFEQIESCLTNKSK